MENLECLLWYALYVKPRHEKQVAVALDGKGYDAFLPTYTKSHKDSKAFELPLFPGYVFCRLNVSRTLPIMTTPGVFSIVGSGKTPQVISEEEIERIRLIVSSGFMARPWPYIAPGQEIGWKRGHCGVFEVWS